MKQTGVWQSDLSLPEYEQNIAVLVRDNTARFGDRIIYQEIRNGSERKLSWNQLSSDILSIQQFLLDHGFKPGDRMAVLSRNRMEMLEMELAVMSMGAVFVPIFAGFPCQIADSLVAFCEPAFVVVADQGQYDKISSPHAYRGIIHFDPVEQSHANLYSFRDMVGYSRAEDFAGYDVPRDSVCLMMYTSGTMGKPKCVQLTHGNILSQQAALRLLWNLSEEDRFLSYLPWHHSFGGIFEKYAAITNGALLSLEHGFGKNTDLLIENWKRVRPTVFFSVPKIYQEIVTRVLQSDEVENIIFHDGLRFIFTAAAPLPKNISDVFQSRNVPIMEGWGLTETSPCCTITDPKVPREPGVVGFPIPGVQIKIADDGEIMIRGANVMKGYFRNPEVTRQVLSDDGWFATGDVGEFTDIGLRLISRKDRIFKLTNAEKVIPTEIENLITKDCAFLTHAYVTGSGRDHPVALLFPNKAMFSNIPDKSLLKGSCECPRSLADLSSCLNRCLRILNDSMTVKFYRLNAAMLVDYELSIENEELTPSMKLAPNVVGKVFKADIEALYDGKQVYSDKVYVIHLE
ncbi:MAG: AMP-binding protein [Chlorobi bacterium]|nr:AMP-binding protein [Chlorobiota bacterium]